MAHPLLIDLIQFAGAVGSFELGKPIKSRSTSLFQTTIECIEITGRSIPTKTIENEWGKVSDLFKALTSDPGFYSKCLKSLIKMWPINFFLSEVETWCDQLLGLKSGNLSEMIEKSVYLQPLMELIRKENPAKIEALEKVFQVLVLHRRKPYVRVELVNFLPKINHDGRISQAVMLDAVGQFWADNDQELLTLIQQPPQPSGDEITAEKFAGLLIDEIEGVTDTLREWGEELEIVVEDWKEYMHSLMRTTPVEPDPDPLVILFRRTSEHCS
jgi:hypothetical protein